MPPEPAVIDTSWQNHLVGTAEQAPSYQIMCSQESNHPQLKDKLMTIDFTNITPEQIYELLQKLEEEMRVGQNRAAVEQEANQVIWEARENGQETKPPLKGEPVHNNKAFALVGTT